MVLGRTFVALVASSPAMPSDAVTAPAVWSRTIPAVVVVGVVLALTLVALATLVRALRRDDPAWRTPPASRRPWEDGTVLEGLGRPRHDREGVR